MMKRKILCAFAAAALILTACGEAADNAPAQFGNYATRESGAALKASGNASSYDMAEEAMVDGGTYEEDAYAEEPSDDGSRESNPIDVDEGKADENTKPMLDREKIIYNGRLNIETLDYNKSKKSIKKLVADNDGIIQAENEYYNNSDWYYNTSESVRTLSLTVRVPSAKFNEIMEGADGIGRVTEKSMDASNVTREYYDVQSRLKTKRAELARFEELLGRADKIKDILEIEDHITEVQYEIDSAESRLENINLDVAYSTVTINVTEVVQFTSDDGKPTSKLEDTLLGAWHFFGSFMWGLFRFVLYVGPCAVVIGIILYFIRKLFKKFYKPRPKKERRPLFRRNKATAPAPVNPPAVAQSPDAAPTQTSDAAPAAAEQTPAAPSDENTKN